MLEVLSAHTRAPCLSSLPSSSSCYCYSCRCHYNINSVIVCCFSFAEIVGVLSC